MFEFANSYPILTAACWYGACWAVVEVVREVCATFHNNPTPEPFDTSAPPHHPV